MKYLNKQREEILAKQNTLEKAREQLKKEFIGIDDVIDEIISSVSSWYLFPEIQEKPVVVNLWGLTGTGKSSLVNRLAELLQQTNRYYRFDVAAKQPNREIRDVLEEIYINENGFPIMIAFDEFQNSRTLDRMGDEIDKPDTRIIWELIDSGKFQITEMNYTVREIYELVSKIRYFLAKGMRTSKGMVLTSKKEYAKELDFERGYLRAGMLDKLDDDDEKEVFIVPTYYYEKILEVTRLIFRTTFELREKLLQINGRETVKFLVEILEHALSPKIVDCSKSIIFVVGNLDEAYTMSKNYNPDMNADAFHELSLKINVTHIKAALRNRFRNEQISRLGNTHIIYPAFDNDTFEKIIDMELSKISERVYEEHKIKLQFDDSVKKLIYREGVYPAQGTRPVFSTIYSIVNTRLAKVVSEMIINRINSKTVVFSFGDNKILIDYIKNGRSVHVLETKQLLKLETLRTCKKDDVQSITAVHESGHAVISTVLLKTLPDLVLSNTAETDNAGFIFSRFKWNYISRKQILSRLAMYLAGYAAEKIVFGDENVTVGAEDDIENSTSFIMDMLKSSGMGQLPAAYHVKDYKTNRSLHDVKDVVNQEGEKWISSALALAEKTLCEQEVLLLKMADHLSDNRGLKKDEIKEMVRKYAKNFDVNDLIENGDNLFYRKHLKSKVKKIERDERIIVLESGVGISLNNCSIHTF